MFDDQEVRETASPSHQSPFAPTTGHGRSPARAEGGENAAAPPACARSGSVHAAAAALLAHWAEHGPDNHQAVASDRHPGHSNHGPAPAASGPISLDPVSASHGVPSQPHCSLTHVPPELGLTPSLRTCPETPGATIEDPTTAESETTKANGGGHEGGVPWKELAKTGVDIVTDFIPGVSNVKDAITAITGTNPVTGEHAGVLERVMAGVTALPGLGNVAGWIGKGSKDVFKAIKGVEKVAKVEKEISKGIKGTEEIVKVEKEVSKGITGIEDVTKAEKDVSTVEKGVGETKKNVGRTGKQARLRELAEDPMQSSSNRGWIKQEINQIKRGKRTRIRNPRGKELAHERGREAAKGFDYKHSHLQDEDLHKIQHKYDNYGKRNKIRPVNP